MPVAPNRSILLLEFSLGSLNIHCRNLNLRGTVLHRVEKKPIQLLISGTFLSADSREHHNPLSERAKGTFRLVSS
jgi:hypothetical protein